MKVRSETHLIFTLFATASQCFGLRATLSTGDFQRNASVVLVVTTAVEKQEDKM